MKDTLFIQFYNFNEQFNNYELNNGFSDTYDLCKNIGDFHWVKHKQLDENLKNHGYSDSFIIKQGVVYVSASFVSHLYQVYLWALRYPKVNFIVGGPCIFWSDAFQTTSPLPKNITLINQTVEEYFNKKNFSYEWKLQLPEEIQDNKVVSYSYSIDNICYWRKCSFCLFSKQINLQYKRKRTNFLQEYNNVKYNGKKEIRLNSDSFSPRDLKTFFKDLTIPNDINHFRIFLRPSEAEYQSLKYIKVPIQISLGLEFPTYRMWKYMNKGYNYQTVSKVIKYMAKNSNFKLIINIILGWNNLKPSDIIELRKFLLGLDYSYHTTFAVHELFIFNNSNLEIEYPNIKVKKNLGPFYVGYYPSISKEQVELNLQAKKVIEEVVLIKQVTEHIINI